MRLIAKSPFFDGAWYLEQYPDVRSANVEPAWHYLAFGASEGRNPGPHFDNSWYLEQCPDVRRARMNPLVHYIRYGQLEGRQPSMRISGQQEPTSVAAVRDHYARLLMARLTSLPRFASITQICETGHASGIDEAPEWQIWTERPTTGDQLRIEEQLESLIETSSSILHIGAGNSSLGRRFAPRVARVLATTLHDEERTFAEGLGIKNYAVVTANKFSEDMDRIDGEFDFIVDNNPSSFACCLFHFSRMMISYAELLKKDGGQLLTAQPGLSWVCPGNDRNWSFQWQDWARLGEILGMPARQVTDVVYSMQCLPDSGVMSLAASQRIAATRTVPAASATGIARATVGSVEGAPASKISRLSVEYNLTEHCNVSCYGCDHASPLLRTRFASIESFSSDLRALAQVFHSREFRILGGEPLLHPQLLDFLTEARRIGIADKIVLFTNGVLLHEVPDGLWKLIDQLKISAYPGVRRRLDDARCAEICKAHNVELTIKNINQFEVITINNCITDTELVRAIYRECKSRTVWSCHTVYEGRFYKCPVAPFTGARLALRGVAFDNVASDGVALHNNPNLYEELDRYLNSPVPLAACSYCLGSSGRSVPHRQLNRKGHLQWLAEDNTADIEWARRCLNHQNGDMTTQDHLQILPDNEACPDQP
jgi:MoaA/NifB/PqqE/SkfB family radical SAM enzyme